MKFVESGASVWFRPRAALCLRVFAFSVPAWIVLTLANPNSMAGGVVTREEALAAAFPGAEIKSERIFLTEQQHKDASVRAGVEIPSPLIARYAAVRDGKAVGRAYVDTHVVRTKKESLLIILDENGAISRIEVTAFLEPPEYQAPAAWYGQYRGKTLNNDLQVQRAIRPVAGATLTAQATNQAARRVLAIDQVLSQKTPSRGKP